MLRKPRLCLAEHVHAHLFKFAWKLNRYLFFSALRK
jgi:hypothetical protein